MANLPGSIKNLNTLLGEQLLDGSGGGGSSDFSTAEVTVTNNTPEDPIICDIANIQQDSGTYYTMGSVRVAEGETQYIVAILYKNDCTLVLPNNVSVAITGNASDFGDGNIGITGDCTITIS